MKTLFLLLFLASTINALEVQISSLNGEFDQNSGHFQGGEIIGKYKNLSAKFMNNGIEISKNDKLFIITQDNIQFSYQFEKGSIVDSLEQISFKNLEVTMKKHLLLKASINNVLLNIGSGIQEIPQLSISCNGKDDLSSDILPCLDLSLIKLSEVLLDKKSILTPKGNLTKDTSVSIKSLKNIVINIYQKDFTLNLTLPDFFNAKLKVNGIVDYDSNGDVLIVEIKTAKVGILNVRDIILKEIINANISTIKVEGSKILINI